MGPIRAIVVAALVAALSGCSPVGDAPSPTPSTTAPAAAPTSTSQPAPTQPAIAELELTPDGLGPLLLGSPPPSADPDVALVVFDADYCEDAGGEPGLWVANYPGDVPFAIGVSEEGDIIRIDTWMGSIPTDTGLTIGSSLDDVLAAYPDGFDDIVSSGLSDVYVVTGTRGKLLIEVAKEEGSGYWPADQVDTVRYLLAIDLNATPGPIAASDNVVGMCPIP